MNHPHIIHIKLNSNEKKIDAALLTTTAQDLKLQSEKFESELLEIQKQSNKLTHLLEHAVWEEDMIVEERIVFNGQTADFVKLIGPLIRSRKWTVNERHEVKPFLRSLLSVFRIRYNPDKEYLTLGRLVNVVQEYLDDHKDDELP